MALSTIIASSTANHNPLRIPENNHLILKLTQVHNDPLCPLPGRCYATRALHANVLELQFAALVPSVLEPRLCLISSALIPSSTRELASACQEGNPRPMEGDLSEPILRSNGGERWWKRSRML